MMSLLIFMTKRNRNWYSRDFKQFEHQIIYTLLCLKLTENEKIVKMRLCRHFRDSRTTITRKVMETEV